MSSFPNLLKNIAAAALSIACAYLLQMTVGPWIRLGYAVPNLMIAAVATYGLILGNVPGMLVGFAGGFLLDCADPSLFGIQTLLYMLLGYASGAFRRFFYGEGIRLPLALICSSDFLYNTVLYLGRLLLHMDTSYVFYLFHLILPEVIYTAIAGIIFYRGVYALIRWANQSPRRS